MTLRKKVWMTSDLRVGFQGSRNPGDILHKKLRDDPGQRISQKEFLKGPESTLDKIIIEPVEKAVGLCNGLLNFDDRQAIR